MTATPTVEMYEKAMSYAAVFDELLQKLDNDYDAVCAEKAKIAPFASDEIIEMSENLLVNLAKLQEAISQKMADMKYAN